MDVTNECKAIPLDDVDKEAEENHVLKKGGPTIRLEDFVGRVLFESVGDKNSIPAILQLLEEYELTVCDGVMNPKEIDTTKLIGRIKLHGNNVMSDLWEVLLIKDRHYSIHQADVAEAYNRAGKSEFPWLGIDEKLSSLPCNDFIEINDTCASSGLPATESDYKDALKQDCWTAREAICWLKGRHPDYIRGDIEHHFRKETDLAHRAIESGLLNSTKSFPIEWIRWAASKEWELPNYLCEFILNDEPIDWVYWATMPAIKCCEAAKLSLGIDPIQHPDAECSLGQLTSGIKMELRKRERWLESHSDTWTLPELVAILGEKITPDGMNNAIIEWSPNKQVSEPQGVATKELAHTKWFRETWLAVDKPTGTPFFNKLKEYNGNKESPILEWYHSSQDGPGVKLKTETGSMHYPKSQIQKLASKFSKEFKQQKNVSSKK